jgi:hypothetical protein
MTTGLVILAVGMLVLGASIYLGAQRRLDDARAGESALRAENARLHRAVGSAEQSLRALANDPRLDTSLAVQVDIAIEDLHRAAGDVDTR